jgi:hypothetical protein
MPGRDLGWVTELEESKATVREPERKTTSQVHYELHNPLWSETEEDPLEPIDENGYDTVEITPELDDNSDMPLP